MPSDCLSYSVLIHLESTIGPSNRMFYLLTLFRGSHITF
jgi:hypothetical protein